MEKIAAACAMGWSIELEKGLRSKKPGSPIESIHQIGPKLKQWTGEPQLTMPVFNMFGLVPGEDRLFADAILFRLADAFVSGDKVTRIAVIKVFLSTLRHCKTKDGRANGIFSSMSKENRLELLIRAKVAHRADCVQSRALALVLFGCWADIAKDTAEIRHAILSSLLSCHVSEVKATLFAAGCFSEVSDDFGSVFLERLLNFMTSPKTSPALKIAGARAFSKIHSSFSVAIKSYKAGAELVQRISEEDILSAMLISLTKLSCKTGFLISEQVSLLMSILAQKSSLETQATALRCLSYIGASATCLVPISASLFQTLIRMFKEPNVPSLLRCDILRILLKMIAYGLPGMPLMDVNELMKQLRYVEDATRSSFLSERLLALEVLVCVCNKLKGRSDVVTSEGNSVTFLSKVVSALCGQITQVMTVVSGVTEILNIDQELGSLLKLLLVLVENHSELGCFVLDKLHLLVGNIVNSHIPVVAVQNSAVHKVVNARAEDRISVRMCMFYLYRFFAAFLDIMDEAGADTDQIVRNLKNLVTFVCGNSLFDCTIHTYYALLLHSPVYRVSQLSDKDTTNDSVRGLGGSPCKLLESETLIHECVENMVVGEDNWYAYRAGKYASRDGVWHVANFIFQQLERRVRSNCFCQWLKFLVKFTHSEMNVQVLLRQTCSYWPPDHVPYVVGNSDRDTISSGCIEKLVDACNDIHSSDKLLETISPQTQTLYFQRWFLTLRVKILLILADLLKLLDTCLSCKVNVENMQQPMESDVTDGNPLFLNSKSMRSSIAVMSVRLSKLAEECDFIALSFMDMDSKSLKLISALAFTCSLLAFCTEATSLIANSPVLKMPADNASDCLYLHVQDLAGRLWHKDPETCVNLMSLLKEHGLHEGSLHLLPRCKMPGVGCISEDILTVFRSSVKEMIRLKNKSPHVHCEDTTSEGSTDGMQLLLNVVAAWTHIPFRIPEYFFRVRPSIGSILISSSTGGGKQNEISISAGSYLSLNLCIQLKNVPPDVCSRFSKIYCILYCKTSFLLTRHDAQSGREFMLTRHKNIEMQTGFQALETDMLIDLNKKLQCYVMKQTRDFMKCSDCHTDGEAVEVCVCFETNGTTQGFSTCLMDVSAFPVGSYRIHWHSGGVDSQGAYWSILPFSPGPVVNVRQ